MERKRVAQLSGETWALLIKREPFRHRPDVNHIDTPRLIVTVGHVAKYVLAITQLNFATRKKEVPTSNASIGKTNYKKRSTRRPKHILPIYSQMVGRYNNRTHNPNKPTRQRWVAIIPTSITSRWYCLEKFEKHYIQVSFCNIEDSPPRQAKV